MKQKTDLTVLSHLLKVIAEPKRLEILALLLEGTHCNCEMGDRLNMAPNLISHHLRVLHDAGLIETERDVNDARWVYYSINAAALNKLVETLQNFMDTSSIHSRILNCGPRSKQTADHVNANIFVQPNKSA